MEYQTLDDADKLRLAKDALYGAEQDHFRVSLDPASGGGQARLDELEARIKHLREEFEKLDAELQGERDV